MRFKPRAKPRFDEHIFEAASGPFETPATNAR
jgi:hypothetical protein